MKGGAPGSAKRGYADSDEEDDIPAEKGSTKRLKGHGYGVSYDSDEDWWRDSDPERWEGSDDEGDGPASEKHPERNGPNRGYDDGRYDVDESRSPPRPLSPANTTFFDEERESDNEDRKPMDVDVQSGPGHRSDVDGAYPVDDPEKDVENPGQGANSRQTLALPPFRVARKDLVETQRQVGLQMEGLNKLSTKDWLTNFSLNRLKFGDDRGGEYGSNEGQALGEHIMQKLRKEPKLARLVLKRVADNTEHIRDDIKNDPVLTGPLQKVNTAAKKSLNKDDPMAHFEGGGHMETIRRLRNAGAPIGVGRQHTEDDNESFRSAEKEGIDELGKLDPEISTSNAVLHNPDQCAGGPPDILWHEGERADFEAAESSLRKTKKGTKAHEDAKKAYHHQLKRHVGRGSVNSTIGKEMWWRPVGPRGENRLQLMFDHALTHMDDEEQLNQNMNVRQDVEQENLGRDITGLVTTTSGGGTSGKGPSSTDISGTGLLDGDDEASSQGGTTPGLKPLPVSNAGPGSMPTPGQARLASIFPLGPPTANALNSNGPGLPGKKAKSDRRHTETMVKSIDSKESRLEKLKKHLTNPLNDRRETERLAGDIIKLEKDLQSEKYALGDRRDKASRSLKKKDKYNEDVGRARHPQAYKPKPKVGDIGSIAKTKIGRNFEVLEEKARKQGRQTTLNFGFPVKPKEKSDDEEDKQDEEENDEDQGWD